jgi:hypothetical protein
VSRHTGKTARVALGVTLTIIALVAIPYPRSGRADDKTAICHFQPETQRWKKLRLGGKSAASHLAHHDDASPGGDTSVTTTPLDQDCVPIIQIDPCTNPEILVESYITLGFDCGNVQTDRYDTITDIQDCCRVCYATPGCDVYAHGFASSCIVYKNCETAGQPGKSDICPVGISGLISAQTRDGGLPYIAAGPCYP